eukprot:CAMPEP_0201521132 /NCGR_PEP_ID=MMETSP0161_2-20130828/14236_1 /ASSEMBLY_ACC=CAM_ASM_000251 /TAXON_ID=180227 /ORGANISM="Neoparamoeba aestuarina, Strain SoJaBio B1-5/56/2" /LENGTH=499 /DNA_ID=CAMNT_0047919709 /DNA_START=24 /DNA_END=1523 /DNA_ORIENTATION=+
MASSSSSLKVLLVCCLLLVAVYAEEDSQITPSVRVRVTHNGNYEKLYDDIPRVSIAHPVSKEQVDTYILREDLPLLEKHNYEYEVEEEDRTEYLKSRALQAEKKKRSEPANTQNWAAYHHYDDLEACLRNYTETYPNVTELFTIGKSSQGREMWGIKITQNIDEESPEKPELHYIGNMHGDEVVGRELLLRFIGYYLDTYHEATYVEEMRTLGREARAECAHPIVRLMEETVLYIIPSMNPDGFELGRRENANRYDLNRNFPDQFRGISYAIQPETRNIMDWTDEHNFVISINFHGGDIVVSYPYDGTRTGMRQYSKSPEDEVIVMMAKEYASFNSDMLANRGFTDGVTNGAAWYPLYGGMADWKYEEQGDIELTVELSTTKWPSAYRLQNYWEQNQHSMTNFLTNIFRGVWGRITYTKTKDSGVEVAKPCSGRNGGQVWADSIEKPLITSDEGYYFRVLVPGTHKLVLSCGSGRNTNKIEVEISSDSCLPERLDYHFD